jgi:tetratricopeptide (TPR) repeat protein
MRLLAAVPAIFLVLVGQASAGPLEEARQAYAERADQARAAESVRLFTEAASLDTGSYEARWEGARATYFLGEFVRTEAPDDERESLFQAGIELAKEAVALKPDGVEGHFWLGVLYGVYGEARGIFKSLGLAPTIKEEMLLCLELDRSVEGFGPDRVLGRLYHRLPWFKGGDDDLSQEHLERSLEGEPGNALTMVYLAETLKSQREKERAVDLLREVLKMTPDRRWEAEHPRIRQQAESLLKKLE